MSDPQALVLVVVDPARTGACARPQPGPIERCHQVPSANRRGWAEACCWLLPDDSPAAQVKVGQACIDWTTVPDHAWVVLKREEQRRIYADESGLLDYYGPKIELVGFLPRERWPRAVPCPVPAHDRSSACACDRSAA